MTSPFEHLTPEQWRALLARSRSGERQIFAGEEAGGPATSSRHGVYGGQFFEVEPEQLIDVAKSIAAEKEPAQKTIERAYALICEAHLVSRNIRHWNEKARRNHVDKRIHEVVEGLVIRDGDEQGKVNRAEVLSAFLKSKGRKSNATDDRKLFKKWIDDSLRIRSFRETIPWNPDRPDFDRDLHGILCEKGWIQWLDFGGGAYLILPERTQQPRTRPRRKRRDGEHVTRPWWETKTVWWPSPSNEEIKEFKRYHGIERGRYFPAAYAAKTVLEKFDRWLEIQDRLAAQRKTATRKRRHDSDTGQFE